MEVILSCTRDVSIYVLFVPTIHGTNGVDTIVVKFDKVVLFLELFNVYHADSAILFNSQMCKYSKDGLSRRVDKALDSSA